MRAEEVRALLRRRIDEGGGAVAWGRRHGVSDTYARDCAAGRREPGPAILAALGLTRTVDVDYAPAANANVEAAGD